MSAEKKKTVTKHTTLTSTYLYLGASYDFYGHTFARVTGESIVVKVFFSLIHTVHERVLLLLR